MTGSAAREFESQWTAATEPPDVFTFLATQDLSATQEKLAVILRDQQCRWRNAVPLLVEDYLKRLPELSQDPDARLRLILSEYELRTKHATVPPLDDFCSRFSDLADTLRSRLSTELTVMSDDDAVDQTLIEDAPPELVGRYRLGRVLGQGAYGNVYQGFDDQLHRPVAVKVPKPERFQKPSDADDFLNEARLVASLDHRHIVPVHDVGRTADGAIYIVSKFVEGMTLRELLRTRQPDFVETVRLLIPVAEALHHAHVRRLIHRDVKPGNILIEASTGEPYITDFGLAVRDADFLQVGLIAGTPAYMSPEQARGEGHRLDGRSDLFALGAVFYLMLTGHKAFTGATTNEILHHVVSEDPQPPTSIAPSIPAELERICLKALSKRISGRHPTAAAFAAELREWQLHEKPEVRSVTRTIVPHGLRSFDANDADFFSELLPGPRTRDGVPETVQFWIQRLQQTDSDSTFRVGLIYGPSGCGKSSLVKAAILPQLPDHVTTIYIEATPGETESRLLRGIRKQFPELNRDLDLVQSLQWLRQHKNGKAVIVIDQLEQWFHSIEMNPQSELIRALGQCDGGSLQAVVMIRDDFAMAAARFMEALEIPIVQGENFATVDLFDEHHAVKVLGRFGQAFGKLPADAQEFTESQTAFLTSAAAGLANGGQVVPVQLALFAEMIRNRNWEPATLQQVGGTQGVGASFLEETFSSRSANPVYRKHEQAAREVLKALLPGIGTDIKGHMQSHEDLRKVSGYQNREGDFNDLLRMLDGGLRLITPTDPDGPHSDSGSGIQSKHYQLTHDYLVPSLREWLTRKQQSSRHGRAELRLEERCLLWSTRRERRQLPSFVEWASILWHVRRETWSGSAIAMMNAATKLHVGRLLSVLCAMLMLTAAGLYGQHLLQRRANAIRTSNLVGDLWQAKPEHVPRILDALDAAPSAWRPTVQVIAESEQASPEKRARAWLALSTDRDEFLSPLVNRLLICSHAEHGIILDRLALHSDAVADLTWERTQSNLSAVETVQAAVTLARTAPSSERWKVFCAETVDALLAGDPLFVNAWVDGLFPVRNSLHDALVQAATKVDSPSHRRRMAVGVIGHFGRSDVTFPAAEHLVELTLFTEESASTALADVLLRRRDEILPLLMRPATEQLIHAHSPETHAAVQRKTAAVLVAHQLGESSSFWENLNDVNDPRVRTELINSADRWELSASELIAALTDRPPLARQAVVLGLASNWDGLSDGEQRRLMEVVTELYQNDSDAGVHSAAGLTLRQKLGDQELRELQEKISGHRIGNWQVLPNGLCMVSVDRPGKVRLGSALPGSELGVRLGRRSVTIDHPFQISTTEVTVRQFRQFDDTIPYSKDVTPSPDCPMSRLNLYDAMKYCRWLSEQQPWFDSENCCYPRISEIGEGMSLSTEDLLRPGFRLPTIDEWEYTARAGSMTDRFFGDADEHLSLYCWWVDSSNETLWPVAHKRPNGLGLFDVYGNVREWVHDPGAPIRVKRQPMMGGDYRTSQRFHASSALTATEAGFQVSVNGFRIVCIRDLEE
ncbi:MAG: protein kinase [Planctomycetaceae bacterium]